MQATLAGPQIADAEKKTRRKPEGVRPKGSCKRLQGPVYFSLLKWRVEGHLLNKNGSYWRMNRPMLTQQHFPGNVPRIQFYAHLQRPGSDALPGQVLKRTNIMQPSSFSRSATQRHKPKTTIFSANTINQLVVDFRLWFTSSFFVQKSVRFSCGLSTQKQAFPHRHSYHMVNAEPLRTTKYTSYN